MSSTCAVAETMVRNSVAAVCICSIAGSSSLDRGDGGVDRGTIARSECLQIAACAGTAAAVLLDGLVEPGQAGLRRLLVVHGGGQSVLHHERARLAHLQRDLGRGRCLGAVLADAPGAVR